MASRFYAGVASRGSTVPASGVAIANETMARTLWPERDALGQQVVVQTFSGTSTKTIVGISRNVPDAGHRLTSPAELYLPFGDEPVPVVRIVVKTREPLGRMVTVIRQEVAAVDPLLPVGETEPLVAQAFRLRRGDGGPP